MLRILKYYYFDYFMCRAADSSKLPHHVFIIIIILYSRFQVQHTALYCIYRKESSVYCMCMYVCMYMYVHMYVRMYMYVCMYMYMYVSIYYLHSKKFITSFVFISSKHLEHDSIMVYTGTCSLQNKNQLTI